MAIQKRRKNSSDVGRTGVWQEEERAGVQRLVSALPLKLQGWSSSSSYLGARVPEGVQLRLSLAGVTCLRNAPQETGSGQGQQRGGAEKGEDYRRQNFWSEE